MPKPYQAADRASELLNRAILKRLSKAKSSLTLLKFDELNVMREIDRLYTGIEQDCRRVFRELYIARYEALWYALKDEKPDEDELDELVEMYLAGMWDEPDELSHYAFGPELVRKRDRAKEAILAVPTKAQRQLELEKAVRFVIQQIGFYVDITEDAASLQALKDAGVKRVQWNVYGDNRVCGTCESMDGNIYPINRVPVKPHLRCRCYLTPVI